MDDKKGLSLSASLTAVTELVPIEATTAMETKRRVAVLPITYNVLLLLPQELQFALKLMWG